MNYDYPMLKLAYDADEGAALDCNAGDHAGIPAQAVADAPALTTANVDAAASVRHDVLMEFFEIMEQSPHKPASELISDILRKSRKLTCAEAGSIFILRSDGAKRWLEAASVQNDVIRLEPADFTIALDTASIAGYVAATGETLVIDDLYAIPAGRPYSFNVGFDEASGYRSRSMMCFPLNNYDGDVIGVVQLINRRGFACVEALPFTAEEKALILPVKQVLGSSIERALMHEHIVDANAPSCAAATTSSGSSANASPCCRARPKRPSCCRSTCSPSAPRSTTRTPPATSPAPTTTAISSPASSACPTTSATRSATAPSSTTWAR